MRVCLIAFALLLSTDSGSGLSRFAVQSSNLTILHQEGPNEKPKPAISKSDQRTRARGIRRMRWSMSLIFAQMIVLRASLLWLLVTGRARCWYDSIRMRLVARFRDLTYLDPAYFVLILLFLAGVQAPFAVARYVVPWEFGMSVPSVPAWTISVAGHALLTIGAVTLIGVVLYHFVRKYPTRWPVLLVIVIAPLSLAQTLASPFFSAQVEAGKRLTDRRLRERLLRVARVTGIGENVEIVVTESRHAGAQFEGVTRKRVILTSELLKRMNEEEIAFVVGHEMGHDALRHLWIDVAVGTPGLLLVFWLAIRVIGWCLTRFQRWTRIEGWSDGASFPLILLVVLLFSLAIAPIENARGRWMEAQADRFALERAAPAETSTEAAISALQKLGAATLTDPKPPLLFWLVFFDHPALDERVEAIETR